MLSEKDKLRKSKPSDVFVIVTSFILFVVNTETNEIKGVNEDIGRKFCYIVEVRNAFL